MKTETAYTARAGSKPAQAIQALLDGPLTASVLASAMDCKPVQVYTLLKCAVDGKAIVRVMDETSQLHFALAGMALDERFTSYTGRGHAKTLRERRATTAASSAPLAGSTKSVDPSDPFGLLAKANSARATARSSVNPQAVARHAQSEEAGQFPSAMEDMVEVSAPAPVVKKVRAATKLSVKTPAPSEEFVAALFSTGELMISVGGNSVRLTPAHQQQLEQYQTRFRA